LIPRAVAVAPEVAAVESGDLRQLFPVDHFKMTCFGEGLEVAKRLDRAIDQVAPDGTVSILYNGIGSQTYVGQHFSATLTGSVAGGVLNAKGRSGPNGRDFSVRVQCR
jgi:hypothetical protein